MGGGSSLLWETLCVITVIFWSYIHIIVRVYIHALLWCSMYIMLYNNYGELLPGNP